MNQSRTAGSALLAALREPVSLLIIGGTLFIAWYLSFWWALFAGLALELLVIFRRLDNPAFLGEVAANQRGMSLGAIKGECDRLQAQALAGHGANERLKGIVQTKDAIWRKYQTSSPATKQVTYQIASEAMRAVRWYYQLTIQLSQINSELKGYNRFKLEAEIYEIEQQAAKVKDTALQEGYARAIKFKREAAKALADMAEKAKATEASLIALEAVLSGVRVRLANATLADIHEFDGELEALSNELTALESAIAELSATPSAPSTHD